MLSLLESSVVNVNMFSHPRVPPLRRSPALLSAGLRLYYAIRIIFIATMITGY